MPDHTSNQLTHPPQDAPAGTSPAKPPAKKPNLKVTVSTSFPDSEVFGVKLVNGRATRALVTFTNKEPVPVTVALIGGALSSPEPVAPDAPIGAGIVRNLTSTRYDVEIPAGEKQALPYTFTTDMHPRDLRLGLVAVLSGKDEEVYQVSAFDGVVGVVEPPTSLLDPQMSV